MSAVVVDVRKQKLVRGQNWSWYLTTTGWCSVSHWRRRYVHRLNIRSHSLNVTNTNNLQQLTIVREIRECFPHSRCWQQTCSRACIAFGFYLRSCRVPPCSLRQCEIRYLWRGISSTSCASYSTSTDNRSPLFPYTTIPTNAKSAYQPTANRDTT